MFIKRFAIITLITAIGFSFQNCSVGGDGVGDLSSQGGSGGGGGGGDTVPPSVWTDSASLSLIPTATNFQVKGDCDIRAYSDYTFELSYLPTGGTLETYRIRGACTNSRYDFPVNFSDLKMAAPTTGVLGIKLIAILPSQEISSSEVTSNVSWKTLSTIGTCRVETGASPDNITNEITGTCTPPTGTVKTMMGYAQDDGGIIKINGVTVVNTPITCVIKTGADIEVTMAVGSPSTIFFHAENCGLGGVGGYVQFDFKGYL